MIYKQKHFCFKNIFIFVSKTLSLCKWFINEKRLRFKNNYTFVTKTFSLCKRFINKNIFVLKTILLSFRKHFHFFRKHFHFAKKSKSKANRKQIASAFLVVAHACPTLR